MDDYQSKKSIITTTLVIHEIDCHKLIFFSIFVSSKVWLICFCKHLVKYYVIVVKNTQTHKIVLVLRSNNTSGMQI